MRGIEHLCPSDFRAERCIGGAGGTSGRKEIAKARASEFAIDAEGQ
jgi:hypothetical protein